MRLNKPHQLPEILQPRRLDPIMARRDQLLDVAIVLFQPRLDVQPVDVRCALLLAGKEEIKVDAEADPGVEGHVAEEGVEEGACRREDGEADPVDEPGVQEGGVGG